MKYFFALASLLACQFGVPANAFELKGFAKECYAPNWRTGRIERVRERNVAAPASGYLAFTSKQPDGGWLIEYNMPLMTQPHVTEATQKFIFYHECAHARFATADERTADCEGLAAMRKDMRVTPTMMAEIRSVFARSNREFPFGGSC